MRIITVQVLSTIADKPHAYRFNETDNWLMFDPYEVAISANGTNWHSSYDEPDLKDIYCYGVDIAKATPVDTLRTFSGTDGQTIDSTRYETRAITAHFLAKAITAEDGDLASDALQRFFASRDPFWLVFGGRFGQPYKRWLVKAGVVTVTAANEQSALIDVPFTNLTGYARSVVNSVEFAAHPELYGGFGINLPAGTNYAYTSSQCDVYNPSDITVDPLKQHHDLTITIKGEGKPTITNATTGTDFAYTKALTASDTLVLSRANPYLNNAQDGINSDHGWIELAPGHNTITVAGLTNPQVTFDFAWYFL